MRQAFGQFQYPRLPLGTYASGFPDGHSYETWLYLSRLGAGGHVPVKVVTFAVRPPEGGQADWLWWGVVVELGQREAFVSMKVARTDRRSR
jgi:hypothetical protein